MAGDQELAGLSLVHEEVREHPFDLDSTIQGAIATLAEGLGGEVHSRHPPAAFCQPAGVAAGAAAEIKRRSGSQALQRRDDDRARLSSCVRALVLPAEIPVSAIHTWIIAERIV